MGWLNFRGRPIGQPPRPDMPYARVLARCVFPRRADEDPRLDAWPQCATDLNRSIKELAAVGELQVWGRCCGSGPVLPVPPVHWAGDAEIGLAGVIAGNAASRSQGLAPVGAWYDSLVFDRRQVCRHLPSKWIGSFRVLSCGFIKP